MDQPEFSQAVTERERRPTTLNRTLVHILRWTIPLTRVKYPANTLTNKEELSNNPDRHVHALLRRLPSEKQPEQDSTLSVPASWKRDDRTKEIKSALWFMISGGSRLCPGYEAEDRWTQRRPVSSSSLSQRHRTASLLVQNSLNVNGSGGCCCSSLGVWVVPVWQVG